MKGMDLSDQDFLSRSLSQMVLIKSLSPSWSIFHCNIVIKLQIVSVNESLKIGWMGLFNNYSPKWK